MRPHDSSPDSGRRARAERLIPGDLKQAATVLAWTA